MLTASKIKILIFFKRRYLDKSSTVHLDAFSSFFDRFGRNLRFGVLVARPQSPGGQISGYFRFRPEMAGNPGNLNQEN